jgi:hypothetical protein
MSDGTRAAVITGGRGYTPTEDELREMGSVLDRRDIDTVITGGAPGVDTIAHDWLAQFGAYRRIVMPADWERHGKAAGPIRNREMLSRTGVRLCIAFKGGRGTWNCIQTAKRLGVDVHVIGEGKW